MDFTQEELQNLVVLVETGARRISEQSSLEQGSAVLAEAKKLLDKIAAPKTEIEQLNDQI